MRGFEQGSQAEVCSVQLAAGRARACVRVTGRGSPVLLQSVSATRMARGTIQHREGIQAKCFSPPFLPPFPRVTLFALSIILPSNLSPAPAHPKLTLVLSSDTVPEEAAVLPLPEGILGVPGSAGLTNARVLRWSSLRGPQFTLQRLQVTR